MALTGAGLLLPLPVDTTPIATTGMPATNLGQPAFSPDGTKIAFNPQAGSLTNNQTLYVMAFNKATMAFSAATLVGERRRLGRPGAPGWPAFFPDSDSIVYHHQVLTGGEEQSHGHARGEPGADLVDDRSRPGAVTPSTSSTAGLPAEAAGEEHHDVHGRRLRGRGEPSGSIQPNSTTATTSTLNYEPTVNPVAVGRLRVGRLHQPAHVRQRRDASTPLLQRPARTTTRRSTRSPTKKLWVAADRPQRRRPGTDPSHPAFYLPAQELLAGNSRGFWVVDPCGRTARRASRATSAAAATASRTATAARSSARARSRTAAARARRQVHDGSDCCDSTNLCMNGFCTANE